MMATWIRNPFQKSAASLSNFRSEFGTHNVTAKCMRMKRSEAIFCKTFALRWVSEIVNSFQCMMTSARLSDLQQKSENMTEYQFSPLPSSSGHPATITNHQV
jgi:hypothetical protein